MAISPLHLLQIVCLAGALLVWFLYLLEAFHADVLQGFLVLLVPFYVFYYAYIKSNRQLFQRVALVAFTAGFILL